MSENKKFEIKFVGNVEVFENRMLRLAEQELRLDKRSMWCRIADIYTRQLTIIQFNPYPPEYESDQGFSDYELSIKQIIQNTTYENFYRWGINGGKTGNHRIIYAVHNYHRVIMLHYFDKQYNGAIKSNDLVPAEARYDTYCWQDPNLYL